MTPQELKNSILQLAIQGKLVEQRPEEGTAQELYAQIQAEKQRLIKEGKLKKEKPLPEITEDEKPFEIPEGWIWVRFGDLGNYKKGPFGSALTKSMFVPKGNGAIKVYEQKNAIHKNAHIGDYYITKEYFDTKMTGFEVLPGDIIVSCAGTIGETYVLPDEMERGIINQALMRMRIFSPIFIPYFLVFFDVVLKQNARASSKGSAIKNIPPFEVLKNYLVPLPPLAEQKRIVAKIEELLPLVDRYEKAWTKLEDFNRRFPEDMKKSILQQAIQGKLVEQRPEEGTAQELYAQIQVEKQRLIKEGKLKKEKPLPEITEDEKPFEIPEGWMWVRLGSILNKLTDGTHATPKYTTNGVPFLSVKDMSSGQLDFSNCRFISELEHQELYSRCNPEYGDLLLTKVGTTGIPVIVDTKQPFSLFVSVALLKFDQTLLYNKFLYNLINSPLVQNQASENTRGVGNKNWVMRDIANTLIVLPPLAEQKRIVEKLEELLAMCERLKK